MTFNCYYCNHVVIVGKFKMEFPPRRTGDTISGFGYDALQYIQNVECHVCRTVYKFIVQVKKKTPLSVETLEKISNKVDTPPLRSKT